MCQFENCFAQMDSPWMTFQDHLKYSDWTKNKAARGGGGGGGGGGSVFSLYI